MQTSCVVLVGESDLCAGMYLSTPLPRGAKEPHHTCTLSPPHHSTPRLQVAYSALTTMHILPSPLE
jgi:hypothetical protein